MLQKGHGTISKKIDFSIDEKYLYILLIEVVSTRDSNGQSAPQIAERGSSRYFQGKPQIEGIGMAAVVSIVDTNTAIICGEKKQNYEEVRKMAPTVEDYIDSTCVASTGGSHGVPMY